MFFERKSALVLFCCSVFVVQMVSGCDGDSAAAVDAGVDASDSDSQRDLVDLLGTWEAVDVLCYQEGIHTTGMVTMVLAAQEGEAVSGTITLDGEAACGDEDPVSILVSAPLTLFWASATTTTELEDTFGECTVDVTGDLPWYDCPFWHTENDAFGSNSWTWTVDDRLEAPKMQGVDSEASQCAMFFNRVL